MGDRLPVDTTGLKIAAIVGGSVLLVLFLGQLLRFINRMLAWASLVVFALLAAYVVYELYTGWSAAESGGHSERMSTSEESDADSISSLQAEYTEGSLSESELERELDQLLDDQRSSERSEERALDREF